MVYYIDLIREVRPKTSERCFVNEERMPIMRLYRYVGPDDIRERCRDVPAGKLIYCVQDFIDWMADTGQRLDGGRSLTVAFVIDENGRLRVADRHSEHIACAGAGRVLSAGEMTLSVDHNTIEAMEVSNQSTGYCPELRSWTAVAAALDRLGILHPGKFTTEMIFRRCPSCGQHNIVKGGWFYCGVCGAKLPQEWNFGEAFAL